MKIDKKKLFIAQKKSKLKALLMQQCIFYYNIKKKLRDIYKKIRNRNKERINSEYQFIYLLEFSFRVGDWMLKCSLDVEINQNSTMKDDFLNRNINFVAWMSPGSCKFQSPTLNSLN